MKLHRAVVEDNNDPLKISRVKVRIFGFHTELNELSQEKFNFIDTAHLPWAEVMGGTAFGLVNGIGHSSVLSKGTWVWCVLDHDDPNKPIIIGTIIGTTKKRQKYADGEGFNDPDGVIPFDARLEETDINRLARNEKLDQPSYDKNVSIYGVKDTIHKIINDNVDTQTVITDSISGADVSQTEPNSTSDATVYPNCSVLETPSGHVFEFDDTPANERIRLYHKSGSYMEIKPDGTFVQKSVANGAGEINHYIHMSDVQEHIAKGVKSYIENNMEEIINGGIMKNVKMDNFQHIGGFFQITADGNLEIVNDVKITGNLEVTNQITSIGSISSLAEVADSKGNLSSLRTEHDKNVGVFNKHTHIGNLGIPTSVKDTPETNDPKIRWGDYTWSNTPQGFK